MENIKKSRYTHIKKVKFFAGRTDEKGKFWEVYKQRQRTMENSINENQVLAFYGFGGVGKSGLLGELVAEIEEKIDDPLYVYYDFDNAQDTRSALESMKKDLSREYGFEFPLFDLALLKYATEIGEDISNPEVKSFIEENSLTDLVFSVMEMLPIVGTLAQAVGLLDKGQVVFRTHAQKRRIERNPEFNAVIEEMQGMDVKEIYSKLLDYFIEDLRKCLEKEKRPLIVLLDTYEQLVNEMSTLGSPLENDVWIRGDEGLIKNLPNTMWVIAGRQMLKWDSLDIDWESGLILTRVETLKLEETLWFLKQNGIENEILGEGLHRLTDGTPAYLDLCVEQYKKIEAKGKIPQIEDFGKNITTLIERYTRYLDDEQKDMVYLFACLEKWNDEVIYTIAREVLPSFSPVRYENVKDFSIVVSDEYGYHIQRSVANVIAQKCPPFIKEKILQRTMIFYEEKIKTANRFTNEYGHVAERWMICACKCFENQMELMDYYEKNFESLIFELSDSGRFEIANRVFAPLWDVALQQKGTELYQSALQTYSSIGLFSKEDSIDYCEKAVNLAMELYGMKSVKTCAALNNLAAILHAMGAYKDALDAWWRIYWTLMEINEGEESENSISVLSNIAIVLTDLGRYEESNEWAKKVYKYRREMLGAEDRNTLRALYVLYVGISRTLNTDELLKEIEKLYELQKQLLGEMDPDTLATMSLYISACRSLKHNDKALELVDYIYKLYLNIYGERYPNTVRMLYTKADINRELGNYETAQSIIKDAYNRISSWKYVRKEDWLVRKCEADIYSDMGEIELALQCYSNLLEDIKTYYANIKVKKHPDIVRFTREIGKQYKRMGKMQEAINQYKQALELGRVVWEEADRNLFPIINDLKELSFGENMMEEYLEYCKQEYDIYVKIHAEETADAIALLDKIVEQCHELGQSETGLEYARKLENYYYNGEEKRINAEMFISHMIDMAHIFSDVGEHEEALFYARKAVENIDALEEYYDRNPENLEYRNYLDFRAVVYRHYEEILENADKLQGNV